MGAAIYSISEHVRHAPHVLKKPYRPCVLVVDDEEAVLHMVRDILEDEGFTVLAVTEGQTAIRLALQGRPKLIITDLMMPHCGGRALRQRLKLEPRTSGIPVLLMSAAYRPQLGDDFAGVLHKPFSIDELVRSVRRHVAE